LDQDLPPPIDEVGEEQRINHLQTNILAPAASKGERHTEKQISPDLKNGDKTKLPI
jgi:hypothetical protein